MSDTPAPARRLTAAEREQWWRENRDRVDELLHSPDPIPRIGGVDNPAVSKGKYMHDAAHRRARPAAEPEITPNRIPTPPATSNGGRYELPASTEPNRPNDAAPTLSADGIELRDGVVMVDGVRFGPWIRQKRIERGMSQRAVTKIVGCSHARIGQLELEWDRPAQQITPLVRKLANLFREE
jgi:DNA-binding XRE family transcriptional regulator